MVLCCDGVQRFLTQSIGARRSAQNPQLDHHMHAGQRRMRVWRATPVLYRQQCQRRCHVPPSQARWRVMQHQQALYDPRAVPWGALLLEGRRDRLCFVHRRNRVSNVLHGKLCGMQQHQQLRPEWRRLPCESASKTARCGAVCAGLLGEPTSERATSGVAGSPS